MCLLVEKTSDLPLVYPGVIVMIATLIILSRLSSPATAFLITQKVDFFHHAIGVDRRAVPGQRRRAMLQKAATQQVRLSRPMRRWQGTCAFVACSAIAQGSDSPNYLKTLEHEGAPGG